MNRPWSWRSPVLALAVLAATACAPVPAAGQEACAARPFAPELTSDGNVWGSTLTADGWLYTFRSREGRDNYRITRSRRDASGRWTPWEPVALGGDHSDLYPAISPDGEHLVFASDRDGDFDLYLLDCECR